MRPKPLTPFSLKYAYPPAYTAGINAKKLRHFLGRVSLQNPFHCEITSMLQLFG
jgi:hypothetical protein